MLSMHKEMFRWGEMTVKWSVTIPSPVLTVSGS